ncbi:glycosyltransferase [Streptosporangium sp. NPDC050855]|uniref:glycosyltransferase n=1 Tax=Streptosporangium sp. NPDC050855 TaxID=3366194 RepID=UPI00379552BD
MRIEMISEHADPMAAVGGADAGGQNVHVAALAVELARRGHDVVVHTRRHDAALPLTVSLAPGATVEYVPAGPALPLPKDELFGHMPTFAAHLARRWATQRPDVAHAHFWMSGVAALGATRGVATLGAAYGVPVTQTFHALGVVKRRWQGAADTSPPERIAIEREIGHRVDAVIATCDDEVTELRAMGVPHERVRVVPCGVDLGRFRPEGPAAGRTGAHRVLSIGRLVPRKGVDTVIRALEELPGVELVIAGGHPDDEESRRLRALAESRGLSGRVHLLGSVGREEVPGLMRSADVVVSVPWYEPFGMVPLEAMACGVPVVASAVGGHLDTVAGCGLLVPPRDPAALAEALRGLLASPGRRRAMGEAGVRRTAERYSWPYVAGQTEAVYRSVVAARQDRLAVSGG